MAFAASARTDGTGSVSRGSSRRPRSGRCNRPSPRTATRRKQGVGSRERCQERSQAVGPAAPGILGDEQLLERRRVDRGCGRRLTYARSGP